MYSFMIKGKLQRKLNCIINIDFHCWITYIATHDPAMRLIIVFGVEPIITQNFIDKSASSIFVSFVDRVGEENVALDFVVNGHVVVAVQILKLTMLTGVETNAEFAIWIRRQTDHCITAPASTNSAILVCSLEPRKRNDNLVQITTQSRPIRHATRKLALIVQFLGEDFASKVIWQEHKKSVIGKQITVLSRSARIKAINVIIPNQRRRPISNDVHVKPLNVNHAPLFDIALVFDARPRAIQVQVGHDLLPM